jgi:hypothetical protein
MCILDEGYACNIRVKELKSATFILFIATAYLIKTLSSLGLVEWLKW